MFSQIDELQIVELDKYSKLELITVSGSSVFNSAEKKIQPMRFDVFVCLEYDDTPNKSLFLLKAINW